MKNKNYIISLVAVILATMGLIGNRFIGGEFPWLFLSGAGVGMSIYVLEEGRKNDKGRKF